ncbi:APC family permease [Paenibacillus kobensis]|uniref:APC family permease n=1 Tax=Paenibacillus kobensis TaxID=59841 RepID=UPI0013E34BB6|nr:APC family permease [Paenibacillus kobensis]
MSHSESVPALSPKKKLTLYDAVNSTLAQMAPAAGIYYGLPVILAATGIGSPLTILIAAVAILLVGLNLTYFSKLHPSSGSMIKYIGMTFGGVTGTAASIAYLAGALFLAASAFIELGGWTADSLAHYGIHVHWVIPTLVLGLFVWSLTIIGIDRSTKIASVAMIIEIIVLAGVSIYVLLDPPSALSAKPLLPSSIEGGLSGIGLGFPLAIYLFIGFENSVALSEETENPRRNTPRAVLFSIGILAVFFIFVSYSIIAGFGNDGAALTASANPFVDLADKYLGRFSFLAIIAGFTSIFGMTIACLNGFSRVAFNSAREGVLPKPITGVSRWGTPSSSLSLLTGLGLIAAIAFGYYGGDWVTGFGYLGTIGTIPLLFIYAALNVAVMFDRKGKAPFLNKYVVPLLGTAAILLPLWAMMQPGQPAPFSYFPWVIVAIIVLGLLYGKYVTKKDPTLAERIGAVTEHTDTPAADITLTNARIEKAL